MKTHTNIDTAVRTLDLLTHQAGLQAMDEAATTPEDRRWADDLAASMQARIAEYRHTRPPRRAPGT